MEVLGAATPDQTKVVFDQVDGSCMPRVGVWSQDSTGRPQSTFRNRHTGSHLL